MFTTLMALIVLIELLFIRKMKTAPCWRSALDEPYGELYKV